MGQEGQEGTGRDRRGQGCPSPPAGSALRLYLPRSFVQIHEAAQLHHLVLSEPWALSQDVVEKQKGEGEFYWETHWCC